MAKTACFLLCLLAASHVCYAYKILVMMSLPSPSHGILGKGLVRHLLNAGHEVTYITPFPTKANRTNFHEIDISVNLQKYFEIISDLVNISTIMDQKVDAWDHAPYFNLFDSVACMALENNDVQKILQDTNQHFDLVIAEWVYNEVYAGLSALYSAPLIWFLGTEPNWLILSLVDEYVNPSYNGYHQEVTQPFSFSQRLSELWFMIRISFIRETTGRQLQTKSYNRIIVPLIEARGKVAPPFEELRFNASLVLGNSHVSTGEAMRLPQNYISIGGFYINEEVEPLPENLQKIIDNAKHGVIYFSMGTNVKSKDFPSEIKRGLLNLFGTLKQTVVWKFEEDFADVPENVYMLKWAPQQSILAHPKCILFITHGGLLSTVETIFAGKPTIAIPVFFDQFLNVARAAVKGFALKVPLSYNLVEDLKVALEEFFRNPKYTQKAKELSFVFHHRPMKPGAELVHWTEHVIQTGGAPHLRSPALLVPWYQKYYLDLALIIFVMAIALIALCCKSVVYIKKTLKCKQKTN